MNLTFDEIYELQKAGRLLEAKAAYLKFLQHHPKHVEAWHMLAILYAEESDFENAIATMRSGLELEPANPSLLLHLANIYKAKGEIGEAIAILQRLIHSHPEFSAAHNNLGIFYHLQNDWDASIASYQTAIDLQPNYVDAYYNLGLVYAKKNNWQQAILVFQSVLELSPNHPGAQFQLALLYMKQERYQEALNQLLQVDKAYPFHLETQSNLGACYLHLGNLVAAKSHYHRAWEIDDTDLQTIFNLGVIEMQHGNLSSARQYYLRALTLNPDFVEAHNNLAVVYLSMKDLPEARKHFCEVLRLQPSSPSIQHTVDILSHKKDINQSPPEYIQALFDSYADHYDAHLLGPLAYKVPQLLLDQVKPYLTNKSLSILDLGAGTGLSGEVFKSYANRMVGVDLSEKMLAVAKGKHIYDELVLSDVLSYLKQASACFDLVIAADVVIYFGVLEALLAGVARVLNAQGMFVFNTEISDTDDFQLTDTGRFKHRKSYIEQLAAKNGFVLLTIHIANIRKHLEEEVKGYIFVLQKQT